MSSTSPNLALPYIQGGQAQKHITHNEALQKLDSIVQLSVVAQASAPPVSPQMSARYIVATDATEEFAGQENSVAIWDGAWSFLTPQPGWLAFDQTVAAHVVFDGTGWAATAQGEGGSASDTLPKLGINASSDDYNRLTVSANASLFHHAGSSHQVKINKAQSGDASTLLFQTGFGTRAEIGTAWSDDFEIKVSPDGSTFHSALRIDRTSGAVSLPNSQLGHAAFGTSPLATSSYVASRAAGLISNATGHLGNAYNYPASFAFDGAQTPDLAGAFVKTGHYTGAEEMQEAIPLDPNRAYRFGVYLRQESVAGDWSGFAQDERHKHYLGVRCYDASGQAIDAHHHARFRHNGSDSLTTLVQPLAPGDTLVHVADASGWNETHSGQSERGLIIFGFEDGLGRRHTHYSRIEEQDLFELGQVDKSSNVITLNQPLPDNLANPDDLGGIWPVGTRLANRAGGWNYKFGLFDALVLDATDTWYHIENTMGGVDTSGQNVAHCFPPGTATIRPVFLMNYTNRSGGFDGHPDTGSAHRVWAAGLSLDVDLSAKLEPDANGVPGIFTMQGDPATGAVTFAPPTLRIRDV